MATNTFKSILAAGIGTSATAIYSTPTNKKSVLIEVDVANVSTDAVTASVGFAKNAATEIEFHIIKNVIIPAGDTFQAVYGQKIVMDGTTDVVKLMVVCDTASGVDVVGSCLEDIQ